MTKFTTGGADTHVGDEYFLTSGDQIRFFFEPAAFSSTTGALTKPKALAINKIGHGLHFLSPPFAHISLTSRNAAIAHDIGFKDPRVLQSMVICKQPEIGGAVESHQDSSFLYTDPPSAVGFWYALEDTTEENGSLSFAPGSHRRCPVRQRFVRKKKEEEEEDGTGTEFVEVPRGKRGVREGEVEVEDAKVEVEKETFVMEKVKAGTLVLIHGNVLHKSEKNLSQKSRFIYTFHVSHPWAGYVVVVVVRLVTNTVGVQVIEGENEYDERNWLQPTKDGFSRLNDVA